ncbi:MAG: hypothetical protein C4521_02150 [Actinobacteria bacterium]|nr:MAG: hypothetical protein C4521_02150 [Actinomycetota bacterium]
MVVIAAIAGLASSSGAATEDSKTVSISGATNPKITISVDTTIVSFGTMDPDVPEVANPAFTATVKSNKSYLYTIEAPATFSGPGSPDIAHLEWDRIGAPPNGYLQCWEGAIDTVPFAPKTTAAGYTYALRLTFGYDEEPDADYTANLQATAVQW